MRDKGDVLFLGGDARSRAMAEHLAARGCAVSAVALGDFGAESGIGQTDSWERALSMAGAVILPMPAFDVMGRVMHPYSETALPEMSELFLLIGGRVPVFGGRVSAEAFAKAADCGVNISDYALSDEVQIRNAVPTAEGAIALAMQALDVTVHGARAAVLGYGRVGYALATRLRALGAQVHVAARKLRDLARIECDGSHALRLCGDGVGAMLCRGAFDVVFNTVPHRLISDEILAAIPERTVLIELASAPGGWNPSCAHICHTVYAPGLPGICAPRTAGMILADALLPTLKEVMRT